MTAPRRILLINHEYPPLVGSGGVATFHIAREMAGLGHQPIVLTAAWRDLPSIVCEDGVTVHRVRALRRRAEHYSVMEMIAFALAAMAAAPGIARQWRPEAAIAFFGLPNGPVGWQLKRSLGLPYVISLQGGDVPGFGADTFATWHHFAGNILRRVWADADAVIANSASLAALARHSAPHQHIEVIPAGADVKGIAGKTDYATRGPLRLVFAGRLVHAKGLDVLIKALAKLPLDIQWRLILAGDGPEWTSLAALAGRLNIADRVQVRGWVDRAELPDLLRDADVFVLPSRVDGTPSALLEAMAAGLPVIGTQVPGTAEAVVDGTTGLLAAPEDVDGLTRAIVALAGDPARRAAMGQAGRTRAEVRFGWPAIAAMWLDLVGRISTAP
ncbi:MAG: glycosyltransferase family 1 protein [Rhodospirillaceae bacterium]|nr:MAG: glycosyltransferase family 1 protein [Rhodospirillaceae bacterium]